MYTFKLVALTLFALGGSAFATPVDAEVKAVATQAAPAEVKADAAAAAPAEAKAAAGGGNQPWGYGGGGYNNGGYAGGQVGGNYGPRGPPPPGYLYYPYPQPGWYPPAPVGYGVQPGYGYGNRWW